MRIGIRTYFNSHTSESTAAKNLGLEWMKMGHDVVFINQSRPEIWPVSDPLKGFEELQGCVVNHFKDKLDVLWELYDFYNADRYVTEAKLKTGAFCWALRPLPIERVKKVTKLRQPFIVIGNQTYYEVINNGIKASRYLVGINRKIFNKKVRPKQGFKASCKFLWTGFPFVGQGPDLILRAFSKAFEEEDVSLTILDQSGKMRGLIKEMEINNSKIELLEGCFSPPDMASIYRAHNALVMPIRFHGSCRPVTEAMACGIPVIVTGYGGPTDYAMVTDAWHISYRIENAIESSKKLEEAYPSIIGISFCKPMENGVIFQWAEPNIANIVGLMRLLYYGKYERDRINNAIETTKIFTWKKTAKDLEEIFLEYL